MKELPLDQAFILIEPGPVTLVTTAVGRRKNVIRTERPEIGPCILGRKISFRQ